MSKNKSWPIPEKLRQKLNDEGFKQFAEERERIAHENPWLYIEPGEMTHADRLELDRQDYKKYYFNGAFEHFVKFNESSFLNDLANIYMNAKHPYFRRYREFLLQQIRRGKEEQNQIPSDHIETMRKKLIERNFLTESGENSKAKPLIAALIQNLSTKYQLTQTEVLTQISEPLKLSSNETKNFKQSRSHKLKGEYDRIAKTITEFGS